MSWLRAATPAVAIFSLIALSSPDADACSPTTCQGARVDAAPSSSSLLTFWSVYGTKGDVKAPSGIEVKDAAGTSLTITVEADPNVARRWLVRTATPLIAGASYDVTWNPLCSEDELGTPTPQASMAKVTVPPSAPTALGKVRVPVVPRQEKHIHTSCDGYLTGSFDEVVASVQLDPDPSFVAHEGVSDVRLVIDGVELSADDISAKMMTTVGGALVASCDPAIDTGLSAKPHQFGFRAFVAGIDARLVTPMVTVDFSCTTAPTTSTGETSPATNGSGASPAASETSSCAATPAPISSSLLPVLALAGVVGAIARGRRSGSATSGSSR
jgi:hypothetical protein